ncbi:hypothetical protein FA15DRAFT_657201 [Coprinopsis marcescibilis]|uniref:Uncharacterized protein n=1 Tax=Coprinopsis marcescibilis TaxID=230819 RepID=A0A5C3KSN9_COPMA|nr:hypothetical protein FA15DRAFT_657201 [Coprinopsis marcescibilis]
MANIQYGSGTRDSPFVIDDDDDLVMVDSDEDMLGDADAEGEIDDGADHMVVDWESNTLIPMSQIQVLRDNFVLKSRASAWFCKRKRGVYSTPPSTPPPTPRTLRPHKPQSFASPRRTSQKLKDALLGPTKPVVANDRSLAKTRKYHEILDSDDKRDSKLSPAHKSKPESVAELRRSPRKPKQAKLGLKLVANNRPLAKTKKHSCYFEIIDSSDEEGY